MAGSDGPATGRLRPGVRFMLASALAFSVMTAFVKLAGERLPSQEIVFARALISVVLSVSLLARARVALWGTRARRPLLLLRGIFGFAGLSCVFYAVTHMPLAEAVVIQYLHPLFTAVLAAFFLGERVDRGVATGAALSLLGVLLVAKPAMLFGAGQSLPTLALLAALGGAFFSGCAYVCVRKLGETEHPLVIVLYFPLVTVPATLPTLVGSAVLPEGQEWLWLLCVGVFAQLGQVALTRGMQHESAARATGLSYMQVVFAALWGVLLFDEIPDALAVAGAGLILAGSFATGRR